MSYYLASRKDMWDILRQEVAREDLQAKDMVETLRGLPYLNAFLRVRLHLNLNLALLLISSQRNYLEPTVQLTSSLNVLSQQVGPRWTGTFYPRER